ncbi:unnamed protein product [Hermetia illucens]|uniref:Uncharacterized protein n=1 Tax=Hermetia illucens TaxID=343691 RepID=A0A7R8URG5_HERIL|nr:unnamed protein product [Hermetia illucens]
MLKAAISPRPASWILERSMDNITYEPWQYFGISDVDCRRRYGIPGQTGKYVFQFDTEVICTTQFSKPMPLENGEVHISLLKNRPGATDQSEELMQFITARFIRIRFQGMHSTANSDNSVGWLLDADSLKKRSFYSVKLVRVSGRLNCNGHASKTIELENADGEIMQQCVCLHNTCGQYCDHCCPLYNDQPFRQGTLREENICKQCECNGFANTCFFDNSSSVMGGVCQNCTHFTTGEHCEKCMSGYYRPPNTMLDSSEPCVKCECNSTGSTGECDPESGVCVCREGFSGLRCDECLPGFKGSDCVGCTCDSRGTVPGGECDDPCECKLYVEDETCSTCAPGYFGLRAENPDGCLKCFCSGVAVTCRSYEMEMTSFETLDAWKVTDITKTIVAYPTRDNDTGNLVFGMYEMPDVEAVYWLAPKSYAGNRLESYGSSLVVQASWVVIRGDTSGKPTSGPNIILIGKNGAKIAYADEEFQEYGATIRIPLTEKGWYHVPKTVKDIVTRLRRTEYRGDPVTRMQFMSVLSDVETVMIRGTYHTDQVESILERATLYAGSEIEEHEWSLVEECQCPPGYSGLSCETCTFGYVRIYENSTTHELIGKCIPCGCNGHSASCDLESGQCGECTHNTFGETCERCKMGYYGNAMHGTSSDCKRCACPRLEESNNFSPSCQLKRLSLDTNQYELDSDEDYVCTQCPDGYIGDHCEQCDDGYYGDPMVIGSQCLPCSCSGGPCDPVTGECITCLGNTEGWRCERCQMGFWGDPTAVCEPCNCNLVGSSSNVCNPETGQCPCRERFTGQKCNECERGFAKSSVGKFECVPCECNVNGSVDSWCDPGDGQCVCKVGVVGLKCDECQEEFYGLTAAGCEGKYIYACDYVFHNFLQFES